MLRLLTRRERSWQRPYSALGRSTQMQQRQPHECGKSATSLSTHAKDLTPICATTKRETAHRLNCHRGTHACDLPTGAKAPKSHCRRDAEYRRCGGSADTTERAVQRLRVGLL